MSKTVLALDQIGDLPSSLTSNGYVKLPGGLIFQWGISGSMGSDSNSTLTFPIPFPTAVLRCFASITNASTTGDDVFGRVISYTLSQITIRSETTGSPTTSGTRYVEYMAIGY